MNLALHLILLQVILSIFDFEHGGLCSAGEPGYLDFDNLPETNFSCQGKVIGGYYADVEAGCQMFHVCTIGQKDEIMDIKFLCLNGTVFDQETRVCERVDEVDCSKSERFYNLNLELYGNNAVTLNLHDEDEDDDDNNNNNEDDNDDSSSLSRNDHHQETSVRPTTTTPSPTTSPRPLISSTTSGSVSYQNGNGYPQHYQPHPPFPTVQTSQSNSQYDDKNGGYHHQYIYHTGDQHNENSENNENQATSYQLFSRGASSTTGSPQHHQISTGTPSHYHATSTVQTLLNSKSNNPNSINPLYHNHGIASTTEQYSVHNNNPRETSDYLSASSSSGSSSSSSSQTSSSSSSGLTDNNHMNDERRHLEPVQATNQGKISKLTISPVPDQNTQNNNNNINNNNNNNNNNNQMKQNKIENNSQQQQQQQQQHRVSGTFVTIPSSNGGVTVRTFYPTPKTSTSQTITQHIHLPPPLSIPQLKPHQVTINLPPPEIQRIIQNPSPLLPSQSRVIVTAKASVSDESGRPLNSTQLVTLPLPTIPSSYDNYREGDESFDPFYRDVPKIRNSRRSQNDYRWSPVKFRIYPRYSRKKRSTIEVVPPPPPPPSKILNDNKKSDNSAYINAHLSGGEEISDDYLLSKISGETDYSSQEIPDEVTLFNNYSDEIDDVHQENPKHFNDDRDSNEIEQTDKPLENSNEAFDNIDYDSEEYSTSYEATTDNLKPVEEIETEFPTDIPTTITNYFESTTEKIIIESNSVNKDKDVDGVLKFTDEIPKSKDKNDSIESGENLPFPRVPQDYVDDNFEPYNYQENIKQLEKPNLNKKNQNDLNLTESSSTEAIESMNLNGNSIPLLNTMASTTSTTSTTSTNPPILTSTTTTTTISPIITTIPMSITTFLTSTTTKPTTSTQSIQTTSSSTTPTSTTIRQKVYKAFTTRKNYSYNPPSTTQASVIIKPRPSLLNPKPAKPLRSYNEGAPKPVIKKLSLSAKRSWNTIVTNHPNEITSTTEFLPKLPLEQILEAERLVMNQITSIPNVNSDKLNVEIEIKISTTSPKPEENINESIVKNLTDVISPKSDINISNEETGNDEIKKKEINRHETLSEEEEEEEDKIDENKHDIVTELSQIDLTTENINFESITNSLSSSTLASVHVSRRPGGFFKRVPGFNCIDKNMYHFYADDRDCRLFHYCSPGFTTKQVLDFRFVCEEGTVFDEQTQSCLHQLDNSKCQKRVW